MSTDCQQWWERRSAARHATPGKLWCLAEQHENFSPAWTSDASRSGLAFVTRAGGDVRVGQTMSISRTDPRNGLPECETLRVCRVEPYGPSLHLIACSRLP